MHIIAYFCYQDYVFFSKELLPHNLNKLRSTERLTRSQVATLLRLALWATLDLTLPDFTSFKNLVDKTKKLLHEMHMSMQPDFRSLFSNQELSPAQLDQGEFLREGIFYAADSAYDFQYIEFAKQRYHNDREWFLSHAGFKVDDVCHLFSCIRSIQEEKSRNFFYEAKNITNELLRIFVLNKNEITQKTGFSLTILDKILKTFCISKIPFISEFKRLSDKNEVNYYPLIAIDDEHFLLFQIYNLAESLYESPFFWMREGKDKSYFSKAMYNRGVFTEQFTVQKLKHVFGAERVFENVKICKSKNHTLGEIDVLVIYAGHLIICQTKSKKLTIKARKGNDSALRDDFKKAISDSYKQGINCAQFILKKENILYDSDDNIITLENPLTEIFIFCIVSDYYPSLSSQVQKFLEIYDNKIIALPYVMEVFFLDILCEFLDNPLLFLYFIRCRLHLFHKLIANHESAILSAYLQEGFEYLLKSQYKDKEFVYIEDSLMIALDHALIVRRRQLPGERTPRGILTNYKDTIFEKIIWQINNSEKEEWVKFGYFLLSLGKETIDMFNLMVTEIVNKTKKEISSKDFSFPTVNSGLTIYCSYAPDEFILSQLQNHCSIRKYIAKVNEWFGLILDPSLSKPIRHIIQLDYNWGFSQYLEEQSNLLRNKNSIEINKKEILKNIQKNHIKKIGRNQLCPCGSGSKYKKCHGA